MKEIMKYTIQGIIAGVLVGGPVFYYLIFMMK
jgi:hypothetical protein